MAKTTAKIVNLDEKEALLSAKYPERGIVPGSLMPASWEDSPFPGKETVEITCVDCGALRRIATQDLFQVSRCVECTKAHQRAQKLAKRAADPEAQARKARAEAAKATRSDAQDSPDLARISGGSRSSCGSTSR